MVKKYIELKGTHAGALQPFLPYLAANKSTTEKPGGPYTPETQTLLHVLKPAGADPIMHQAQDHVFDANYFMPAVNHAKDAGLTTALGLLVIYDTCIHSGPGRVATHRAAFPQKSPKNGGDEKEWVKAYIATRKAWLLGSSNPLVQKTIYRMEAFEELISAGNWDLETPMVVRGRKIS